MIYYIPLIITWIVLIGTWIVLLFNGRSIRYQRQVLDWWQEREHLISPVLAEAYAVTSVPDHSSMRVDADGNVRMADVAINYVMLKEMVSIMQDQESMRRQAGLKLNRNLVLAGEWHYEHPVPVPPKGLRSLLHLPTG